MTIEPLALSERHVRGAALRLRLGPALATCGSGVAQTAACTECKKLALQPSIGRNRVCLRFAPSPERRPCPQASFGAVLGVALYSFHRRTSVLPSVA